MILVYVFFWGIFRCVIMRLLRSVQLKKQNVDLTSETKKKKNQKREIQRVENSRVKSVLQFYCSNFVSPFSFFLKLRNWIGYTRETTRKKLSEHLNYPNTETIHAGFAQQYKIEKCNVYLTILHSS